MSLLVMVQPAHAVVQNPTNIYSCSSTSGLCPVASGVLSQFQGEACAAGGTATLQFLSNRFSCRNIYVERFYLTISGTPVCAVGFSYNSATGYCEGAPPPVCPANGTVFSSGYYDIGTNPNAGSGQPSLSGCDNGCATAYNGDSVGWRVQIAGIYHYFAKGGYAHTGVSCSSGSPSVGAVTAIPTVSCTAGQTLVTGSNGFKKCYDDMTGTVADGNSASAVAAAKTLADAKVAAQIQAAADSVAAAGGSASDVAAAKSVAAGTAAVAAGAPTDNGFAPNDPMNAFCVDNPQASICKEQTAGAKTVGTAALSGLYNDGDLIAGKTVSGTIGGFKTRVLASGIGSAAGGFFTVNQAAGTCPVWSADVPMFGAMSFDFYCQSTFQNLLPWIRSVLLLIFSVIAFRIAIL